MPSQRLPLIVLGGSDRRATTLPPWATSQHPLAAYKGVAFEKGGRRLVEHVVERFQATARFGEIVIAGPARLYQPVVDAARMGGSVRVVDTDGSLARNVGRAIDSLRPLSDGDAIAVTTCDILPDPDEVGVALDDYDQNVWSPAWCPLIASPKRAELRAFGWKPTYRVSPGGGASPTSVLPSHLLIARPSALRLDLLLDVVDVAYRTRNRSVETRRAAILRAELGVLIKKDVARVFSLRAPTVTLNVVRNGLKLSRMLRDGVVEQARLEQTVTALVVRRRFRRRYPELTVRLPILPLLSLAEDIDTEEEARQANLSPA